MNSHYLIEVPVNQPSQISAFKELVSLCDGLLLAAIGLALIAALYRQNNKLINTFVEHFDDNSKDEKIK